MAASNNQVKNYTQALLNNKTGVSAPKKQPGFLDNVFSTVKQLFNPQPQYKIIPASTVSKWFPATSSIQQRLNNAQAALNPYIQQTQKNASLIDKYVTSHQPVASGNYASATGGMYPLNKYNDQTGGSIGNILAYNSNPQPAQDDPQLIGQLGDLIKKQHAPLGLSVDVSPYSAYSDSIKRGRQANEQSLLGASYG